jgi:tetratricopeptide (TPR) repeat protein
MPQGAFAGKRLVPKIVGSRCVGRLPILIYRLSDEDAARLRLRPEGGGTLRGVAPGDVILTTEAMAYCDARTGEDPRDPLARRLRAMLWVDLGDDDRGIGDCDEAIRLDEGRPWAHHERGLARRHRGDADGAIRDFDRAMAIDGSLERPHRGRGRAWTLKGEPAKALVEFARAIQLDPNFAAAYRDRAAAWIAKRQLPDGASDIESAIRLDPQDPLSYGVRALAVQPASEGLPLAGGARGLLSGLPHRGWRLAHGIGSRKRNLSS